ncbi:hypothetical protein M6B38_388965 [Iris pallida]|uniref:Uncharacterized protein n=1 Tax=Iris pallida TaxID=29817 RepID=A0AAX6G0Y2_IRIPA|nr:hypothetical protein M6B38_388965 [Iris pallida]
MSNSLGSILILVRFFTNRLVVGYIIAVSLYLHPSLFVSTCVFASVWTMSQLGQE